MEEYKIFFWPNALCGNETKGTIFAIAKNLAEAKEILVEKFECTLLLEQSDSSFGSWNVIDKYFKTGDDMMEARGLLRECFKSELESEPEIHPINEPWAFFRGGGD